MSLLDIFKKKKEREAKQKTSDKVVIKEEKEEPKDKKKVSSDNLVKRRKKNDTPARTAKKEFSDLAFRVLESPHLTEKAVNLAKENKYVFKVRDKANKIEIKKAIQELYGVKVHDVNIIKIPRKRRRVGRSEGYKSGYKKAIVTLMEGEKIETGI